MEEKFELAKGKVRIGEKLNYLIVGGKTVSYNMSYEMDKLLREFVGKNIKVELVVTENADNGNN